MITLYHGTGCPFEVDNNRPIYATRIIEEAREYALGLTDDGDYNEESYIYAIDIDLDPVEIEDFDTFDSLGYTNYNSLPDLAHNQESGWYCIKHPGCIRLIDHYKNNI